MKYFNMPADFKNETIDRYCKLNQKYCSSIVYETYGQITIGNRIGSGRAYDLIPAVDLNCLNNYIQYSKSNGIGFNYTLNTTCIGNSEFTKEGINEIVRFLDTLYDAGVRSLTIALPSLIELVRLKGYDFEIKASTICQIINANKALAYKKLGVDKIVIDESINRDFDSLKSIRNAFGENIEIIANVICHKNCIYEMFHHNQTSHDSGVESNCNSSTFYSHRCMMKRCENASNILKLAWIRPEDLKYYVQTGINYFKLQGRQAVLKGDPVRAIKCYFNERYDGNLVELLDIFSPTNSFSVYVDNRKLDNFLEPFYKNPGFCKNDCSSCNYCHTYATRNIDCQKINEVFTLASKFYMDFDQFNNMVKDSEGGRGKPGKSSAIEKFLNESSDLNFD